MKILGFRKNDQEKLREIQRKNIDKKIIFLEEFALINILSMLIAFKISSHEKLAKFF